MKTAVYVDGFNVYYGCLKDTPYRWLNPLALAQALLPTDEIIRVRYFTARVNGRVSNPQKPQRQQAYLRALETLPNLSIHYGHYLSHNVKLPVVGPPPLQFAHVTKTDEKGSDVNLATFLLCDGFRGEFDQALVLTNDSDLALPVRVMRTELKRPVVVGAPLRKGRPLSIELQSASTVIKVIKDPMLIESQLPPEILDAEGRTIRKPREW